jgi:hypothetical protein
MSRRLWTGVFLSLLLAFALALTFDVADAHASVTLPGQEDRFMDLWLPFGFLGLIAWSVWLVRRGLTAFYRPIANDHSEATSVVAPAFREDPAVLEKAVRSWLATGVSEVLLVLPDDEPDNLERARDAFADDPQVQILTTDDPAKRNSLTIGIEAATQPIVVLSDSDTLWEPDLLRNLLMPFADPWVGGVGTRQRVLAPDSSVWRRAADWMLDAKYLTYVPAMSRSGAVSCLSGRTVAYRREPLLRVLPDLKGETFWGRPCVSGDDGRLTWLILNLGLKTVYQQNAVAWTMMPDTARVLHAARALVAQLLPLLSARDLPRLAVSSAADHAGIGAPGSARAPIADGRLLLRGPGRRSWRLVGDRGLGGLDHLRPWTAGRRSPAPQPAQPRPAAADDGADPVRADRDQVLHLLHHEQAGLGDQAPGPRGGRRPERRVGCDDRLPAARVGRGGGRLTSAGGCLSGSPWRWPRWPCRRPLLRPASTLAAMP